MVLAAHLTLLWLVATFRPSSVKTESGSLKLVWIAKSASPQAAPDHALAAKKARNTAPRQDAGHIPGSPATALPSSDDDNSIHSMPDWAEELKRVAQGAVARELAEKRHQFDFTHAFPSAPRKPAQIAWDYAATHPIETLPQGGILIHLGDRCVLVLIPLPLVGCAIGKTPASGDLFDHMRDK
jgi:hypothetical protein